MCEQSTVSIVSPLLHGRRSGLPSRLKRGGKYYNTTIWFKRCSTLLFSSPQAQAAKLKIYICCYQSQARFFHSGNLELGLSQNAILNRFYRWSVHTMQAVLKSTTAFLGLVCSSSSPSLHVSLFDFLFKGQQKASQYQAVPHFLFFSPPSL